MSDPAQSVRSVALLTDPSPKSESGDADKYGTTFCKMFSETTRADDELSDIGSECTSLCAGSLSQGLDSWCLADASWSPTELRRPSVISEECEAGSAMEAADVAGAAGPGTRTAASGLLHAAGDAAATAAAAAAAANAVAAQQRQRQREGLPAQAGGDDEATAGGEPRAPPGLSEPGAAPPPSRGSGSHCSRDCSPCVWHWKPQGCFRGRECGYCHLCPEGEIKLRKKAKLATLRSGSRGLGTVEDDQESQQTPQQGEASPAERQRMPSVGSAFHGTGECRPCAWFWKPQGCQNGQECRHCHLCPEGEIKLRKKLKVETMRQDQQEGELSEEADMGVQGDPHEPVKIFTRDTPGDGDGNYTVTIPPPPGLAEPASLKANAIEVQATSPETAGELPSAGSIMHGSGECRPCAWFWKPQGCQNGRECRHCHLCPEGEIKARKKGKAESLRLDEQEPEDRRPEPLGLGPCAGVPFMLPPLPSIGSSLHGTGLCRPCAWFWKPQGCENGRECCHCHLCPNGEIKARRKMKVAVLRHQGSLQEQLELQQEEMGQWEAQWEIHQQAAEGLYQDQQGLLCKEEDASPENLTSPAYSEGVGQSPFTPPVPLDLSASLDSPLPSTGSALHSLGKCRPCAWFWKSTGCLNGQACAHCHLCPEGELKVRKKVKETAMRIGALVPAHRGFDSRSPRVVKIAPVLGA